MSYIVERADLAADRDTILSFWRNNHPKPLENKFQWMYQGNPHGRALVWTIKYGPTGACVGMVAVFPRRLYAGEGTMLAGIMGDFLIHEGHRTAGPAVMLMRSVRQAVPDAGIALLYGFPNKGAEPIMKRAGFQRLGQMIRLTRVLNTRSLLVKYLVPGVAARLVSPIADWALRFRSGDGGACRRCGLVCREEKAFDDRYAEAWRPRRNRVPVLVERTTAYLWWKYLDDPDDTNRIFSASDSAGQRLKGYLVFRWDEDSVEIREIVSAGEDESRCLLSSFIGYIRGQSPGSLVVKILETPVGVREFAQLGFRRRQSGRSVYWYGGGETAPAVSMLGDSAKWFLMGGDEDT